MKSIHVLHTGERIPVGKIICVGRNYREHAREMKSEVGEDPILFIKPSTAIIQSGDEIVMPPFSRELHHEVEFVILIGREGKNIPPESAYEYVFGYGVGLDMTLRDVQRESKKLGLPWSVAKGFDTSAPISDIVPKDRMGPPQNVSFSLTVNGQLRQRGTTRDMVFGIDVLLSYISKVFTLERGDVIFTGTPEGVATVKPGDTLTAQLEELVTLTCSVR